MRGAATFVAHVFVDIVPRSMLVYVGSAQDTAVICEKICLYIKGKEGLRSERLLAMRVL